MNTSTWRLEIDAESMSDEERKVAADALRRALGLLEADEPCLAVPIAASARPCRIWVIRYRLVWCPASRDVRSSPKADIRFQRSICRDGPKADSCSAANQQRVLFDHLVGAAEHGLRNSEAERLSGL
jgi:hypothetical protein